MWSCKLHTPYAVLLIYVSGGNVDFIVRVSLNAVADSFLEVGIINDPLCEELRQGSRDAAQEDRGKRD